MTKERIVVGMSGGVDSSLAASLLAEQGHEVLGVYMENWTDDGVVRGCATWPEDRRDAAAVAKHLGIPFKVINFEKEYREKVIEYFFAEYADGRTPNPDVLCNREIKFGMLLEWATKNGYDAVATGHYARIQGQTLNAERPRSGLVRLLKGIDDTKDQSYFLSQLSREQLKHARFPLGEWKKVDVRKEAKQRKLPVADKPDSQGLCFVGQIDIPEFLGQRIKPKAGEVVTIDGEVIGEHAGAVFYTVGQRRGVGVTKPVPMYVLGTDLERNRVIVGYDRELYANTIRTAKPHWISGAAPQSGRFEVMIRYRMQPAPAQVVVKDNGLEITFDEPQRGPTPGQFAVLYNGDELVGSAVISENPLVTDSRPSSVGASA